LFFFVCEENPAFWRIMVVVVVVVVEVVEVVVVVLVLLTLDPLFLHHSPTTLP